MVPDVGEDFTQQRNLVLHHTKHPKSMTQEHRQAPRSGMIMTLLPNQRLSQPGAYLRVRPIGRRQDFQNVISFLFQHSCKRIESACCVRTRPTSADLAAIPVFGTLLPHLPRHNVERIRISIRRQRMVSLHASSSFVAQGGLGQDCCPDWSTTVAQDTVRSHVKRDQMLPYSEFQVLACAFTVVSRHTELAAQQDFLAAREHYLSAPASSFCWRPAALGLRDPLFSCCNAAFG